MLWHRQAIFESKGDKLSSSAECRIRTHQGLRHQIASRLNAHWQTDWAIEDQAKNLNSTANRSVLSISNLCIIWFCGQWFQTGAFHVMIVFLVTNIPFPRHRNCDILVDAIEDLWLIGFVCFLQTPSCHTKMNRYLNCVETELIPDPMLTYY